MPDALLGGAAALVGVLMFGTNYVPVRRCETHDGLMFGWAMGNGALGVGLLARVAFGGEVLSLGLLGGAIWSVSNALVLPVVKMLGLGVGFALYHGVNLVVGYLVGRLGLFGAPVDSPHIPVLCDCSVLILLLSLVVMVRVEPDMSHGRAKGGAADAARAREQSGVTARTEPAAASGALQRAAELSSPLLAPVSSTSHVPSVARSESAPSAIGHVSASRSAQFDGFSTSAIGAAASFAQLLQPPDLFALPEPAVQVHVRKLWGVLLALLAGLLAGVNTVPFLLWTRNVRMPHEPALHFLFADLLGVWAAAAAMYATAGLVQKVRCKRYPHAPIRPACLSGALWAVGCGGQMIAIDNIGMSTAYVLCAIGPVMVSALISAVVFREIRGAANRQTFMLALALQFAGVGMLAAGSQTS